MEIVGCVAVTRGPEGDILPRMRNITAEDVEEVPTRPRLQEGGGKKHEVGPIDPLGTVNIVVDQ